MPKISLPKFGFKGEKPEAEIDASLPEAGIETTKVDIDADAPSLDIDKPSGKFDINMPDFSLPDIHLPTFGLKGKEPKGDIDVSLPNAEIEVPNAKIEIDMEISCLCSPDALYSLCIQNMIFSFHKFCYLALVLLLNVHFSSKKSIPQCQIVGSAVFIKGLFSTLPKTMFSVVHFVESHISRYFKKLYDLQIKILQMGP